MNAKRMLLWLALFGSAGAQSQTAAPPVHFINGLWFNGTTFEKNDWYAVEGTLTHRPVKTATTVDLHGGYVVPAYGDAHEHMFDTERGLKELTTQYLRDGIFYAQGMTDVTDGTAEIRSKGLVDTPATVDVTYAHGGLTGVNGHPKEVYESMANGFYYPQTDAQRKLVIDSHGREGQAYWEIRDVAMLKAKWPQILASRPDLIKVYLAAADSFKQATAEDAQFARGIDPALVRPVCELAHAAGLRVFAHVDTAYDYHVALLAGVDGMAHLPGYAINATEDLARYRIPDADIALTAQRHVVVIATAQLAEGGGTDADKAARRALAQDNQGRLKKAGVTVLVGSDHYGQDSVKEADYLQSLGVWSNLDMLRMWSVATPKVIFPKREIGELEGGFEASFLVLKANPLESWSAAHQIVDRWKQGRHIMIDPE